MVFPDVIVRRPESCFGWWLLGDGLREKASNEEWGMVCVGHESCWFFWIGSKLEQGLLLQPKRPNMLVEERRPRKMTLTFSFRNVYEDEISQIDLGPLTLHFLRQT